MLSATISNLQPTGLFLFEILRMAQMMARKSRENEMFERTQTSGQHESVFSFGTPQVLDRNVVRDERTRTKALADEKQHRMRTSTDRHVQDFLFKLTPRPSREFTVALIPDLLHAFKGDLLQALHITRYCLYSSVHQFTFRSDQTRPSIVHEAIASTCFGRNKSHPSVSTSTIK